MQFAVLTWVSSNDSAKAGSIFHILDKANPARCRRFLQMVVGLIFGQLTKANSTLLWMQKRQSSNTGII